MKSHIHSNLDAAKMFNEAWWLQYCFCGGRACGNIGDPFFGSHAKELCLTSTCEMTDVGGSEGFCSMIAVECCITSQCAFPAAAGSPTCACCNKVLAGAEKTGGYAPKLFEYELKWDHNFWLYYLLCAGVGVHAPCANSRPGIGMLEKFLCIKEAVKCGEPVTNGIFCSGVGTSLCFWEQCQFPPATGSPTFMCCGIGGKKGVSMMGYGKPGQIEMS